MIEPKPDLDRPLVEVRGLSVHFPVRSGLLRRQVGVLKAVDGVSFVVGAGETLGLVGESGCGKSTTGLALVGLVAATAGVVSINGETVSGPEGRSAAARRRMQIVFQDPMSSLNPRRRIRDAIRAPLDIHRIGSRAERNDRVDQLMRQVGLRPDQADNYPHQFSGGQRQRIGIARALALEPDFVVLDEPVSSLDVSVQAQILNLLADLQRNLGVSMLMISHDLGVVEHVSRRVAVMYLGRVVEIALRAQLFSDPSHPYSQRLLAAAPGLDPRHRRHFTASSDEVPSASRKPSGCAFHPRCAFASAVCRTMEPALSPRPDGRLVACHNR